MNMTKGHEPTSKSGGMKSHLAASPNNNPTTSKKCNLAFSGKNMPKVSGSARHLVASAHTEGTSMKVDSDGDYDKSK